MQCKRCTMEIETEEEDGTLIRKIVPLEYPNTAARCPECGLLTSMQDAFRICGECGQQYFALPEEPLEKQKEEQVDAT